MKPASTQECLHAQQKASVGFDDALKGALLKHLGGEAAPMYQMLQYFLGFLDEKFLPEMLGVGGKRFRPGLCLFLADAYGARETAMNAALSIELYHNFTLIHDDVEDRDEVRRNRPTLWKLWGINHAINSGDALSLIAYEHALISGEKTGQALLEAFTEVIEGQYLDFESSENSDGGAERALLVNAKKTGALIAAACECAGIAAGQTEEECANLRAYGLALGHLFQLADDYRSVWQTKAETGKDSHSDIREHKRTLPFFFAQEQLDDTQRKKLETLYDVPRQLTKVEIQEALEVINATDAKQKTIDTIGKYGAEANVHAEKLSISDDAKEILLGIVETFKDL